MKMVLPHWDGHASEPEQCELIAALIRCSKPQIVVESGTYRGHGAIHMAMALRDNGHGMLHTCDPVNRDIQAVISANSLDGWMKYYAQGFETMIQRFDEIDFAYIDGSGAGPTGARMRDEHFELAVERLRPGGIVCVDDTAADDWSDGEGGGSVQRIRRSCDVNFRFLRGLSIHYKA